MKKNLYIGIVIFLVGVITSFLSGATIGFEKKPIAPFLYGTDQDVWFLIAVAGLIIIIVTVIRIIVKAVKKPKSPTI